MKPTKPSLFSLMGLKLLVVVLCLALGATSAFAQELAPSTEPTIDPEMNAIMSSNLSFGKLTKDSETESTNSFSISNTVATTVPDVLEVQIQPSVVTPEQKIRLTAIVGNLEIDPRMTGTYIDVRFKSPGGHQYKYAEIMYDPDVKEWSGGIWVDKYTANGYWILDQLVIMNHSTGEFKKYISADFPNAMFEVQNPNYNGVTPQPVDLQVHPSTANLQDTVTISVEVYNNGLNINNMHGIFSRSGKEKKYLDFYHDSNTNRWVGSLYISDYIANGTWQMDTLYLTDSNYVSSEYTLEDFPNASFNVINPVNDGTPPELISIDVNPKLVNVGEEVKVSVKAYDSNEINNIGVVLINSKGTQGEWISLSYDQMLDSWTGSMQINEFAASGIWKVANLYMADTYYNQQELNFAELQYLTFEVNNPSYEDAPPIVNSIEISPQVVNKGQYISILIDAYDPSGVAEYMDLTFASQEGHYLWASPFYDEAIGKWRASMYIDEWYSPGDYQLNTLYLEDNYNNGRKYSFNDFPNAAFTVTKYTQGVPLVSLNPPAQDLRAGDRFTIYMDIENVQNLYGAEAKISFDPTKLAVVDQDFDKEGIQIDLTGVVSGITVKNQVDNGQIWFSTAKQGDVDSIGFTGNGQIATITFEVLPGAEGETSLNFISLKLADDSDPPQQIMADSIGAYLNILPEARGGNIQGTVRLEGLYYHSDVEVSLEGTEFVTYTDYLGNFRFENLPEGQYNLIFKGPYWKPVFLASALQAQNVINDFTQQVGQITLYTGDINSDNKVNLPDLSKMAVAYGAVTADATYYYNADLNENSEVDLFDLVLLARNWSKTGYGAETYSIQGSIRNDLNNSPIPYATIYLEGENQTYTTVADEYGQYQVSLAPGSYTITASHENYLSLTTTVTVDATNPSSNQNFYLYPVNDGTQTGIAFTQDYPMITNIAQTSFDFAVSANKTGWVYWALVEAGQPAPTAEELKNSWGPSPSRAVAVAGGGISILHANQEYKKTVSQKATYNEDGTRDPLTAGATYDLYLVAEDNENPATQTEVKQLTVTLMQIVS